MSENASAVCSYGAMCIHTLSRGYERERRRPTQIAEEKRGSATKTIGRASIKTAGGVRARNGSGADEAALAYRRRRPTPFSRAAARRRTMPPRETTRTRSLLRATASAAIPRRTQTAGRRHDKYRERGSRFKHGADAAVAAATHGGI